MTLWSSRMGAAPGRGDDGLHRQPRVRPPARARRRQGSLAHVRGLGRAGILTADEVDALVDGARARSARELASGRFRTSRRPTRTSTPRSSGASPSSPARPAPSSTPGAAATTRSRRRCGCSPARELARVIADGCSSSQTTLRAARDGGGRRLPARLHPPAAGPARAARPPAARARLGARRATSTGCSTTWRRLDVSPLGAGALGGSSLPLDPDGVADELGFDGRFENSLDAVSDRDFVAEALFDLALLGVHLSRHRRGDRPLLERGVRLRPARRRLGDGQLDAAAEEEPRRRRARPWQGRPPGRAPDRLPRRRSRACRSRTTATCKRTRSRCSTRSTRSCSRSPALDGAARDGSRSTSTGCRPRPTARPRRGRPGGVAGRRRDAVSGGARPGRRARARVHRAAACRSPSSSRPTRASAQEALELLDPGAAVRRRTTPGGGRTRRRRRPAASASRHGVADDSQAARRREA